MLALILAATLSSAASTPAVSPEVGIVGMQMFDTPVCSTFEKKSCLEVINDGAAALQIGFSFRGPSGPTGIENALFTEKGKTQCVFTTGSSGTRCVSTLGPGEHGWAQFPSAQVVTITVTWWDMPGLETKSLSTLPGTAVPVTVIGDRALIVEGQLAMKGEVKVIHKDLTVAGNNILHVKY